jgi:hypothetical protein
MLATSPLKPAFLLMASVRTHLRPMLYLAYLPSWPGRLLRYLATRHIFKEVKPDTFANNRLSSSLIKRHTVEEIEAKYPAFICPL